MSKKRNKFTFHRDYYESLSLIKTKAEKLDYLLHIIENQLNGVDPKFEQESIVKMAYQSHVGRLKRSLAFTEKAGTIVFNPDAYDCYQRILQYFPVEVHPQNKGIADQWVKCIDKLNRVDGLSFQDIELIVKFIRSDPFWQPNFLSILKLKRTNPDGVQYWKYFVQKITAQYGKRQSEIDGIKNW